LCKLLLIISNMHLFRWSTIGFLVSYGRLIYTTSFELYIYSKQISCVPIAFTKGDTTVLSEHNIYIMQSNVLMNWIVRLLSSGMLCIVISYIFTTLFMEWLLKIKQGQGDIHLGWMCMCLCYVFCFCVYNNWGNWLRQ
jgi:hypothetical protein